MSEIEKMYKNVGVEYEERYNNCTLNKEDECELKCGCDICEYSEERYIYPLFTAEKQIELIKWLANKFSFFAIEFNSQQWSSSNGLISGFYKNSLEESIADYMNSLWKDLTEEEREVIRGIL